MAVPKRNRLLLPPIPDSDYDPDPDIPLIVISDSDDDNEESPASLIRKLLAEKPTKSSIREIDCITSPPRTPNRLSLSRPSPKTSVKANSVVLPHKAEPLFISAVKSEELKQEKPAAAKIDSITSPPHTPGRLSLSRPSPKSILKTNSNVVHSSQVEPSITISAVELEVTSPKPSVKPEAAVSTIKKTSQEMLASLIAKSKIRHGINQAKINTTVMLPTPASGPTHVYQCHDNEVHSSTGGDDTNDNAITKLFDTCRRVSCDSEDRHIVEKMWKRVGKCDSSCTNPKFLNFTRSINQKIAENPENMHVYLKEFYDELGVLRRSKLKKNCQNGSTGASSSHQDATEGHDQDAVPSTSHSGNEPDSTYSETANERRIRILEKMLMKCSKRIQKYEAQDLSLDELDNETSSYLLIDRYKKKALAIWKKLCELDGTKASSGRVIEKKFVFSGTRYEELNVAISRLVNRFKRFPDFFDVMDVVTTCNERGNLHLRPFQIESLAREIFKGIGDELKRRRILDYEEHYGCPQFEMESLANDPASQDGALNATLEESRKLGSKKEAEVFDAYVLKQSDLEKAGDNCLPDEEGTESQNEESDAEVTTKEEEIDVYDIESDSNSHASIREMEEDEYSITIENEFDADAEELDEYDDIDKIGAADPLMPMTSSAVAELDDDLTEMDEAAVEFDAVESYSEMNPGHLTSLNRFKANVSSPFRLTNTKRQLLADFDAQPPTKRFVNLTAPAEVGVKVKTFSGLENFVKDHKSEFSNDNSSEGEIVIIN